MTKKKYICPKISQIYTISEDEMAQIGVTTSTGDTDWMTTKEEVQFEDQEGNDNLGSKNIWDEEW